RGAFARALGPRLLQVRAPRLAALQGAVQHLEGPAVVAVVGQEVRPEEQAPGGRQALGSRQRLVRFPEAARLLEGPAPALHRPAVLGEQTGAALAYRHGVGRLGMRVGPAYLLVRQRPPGV